MSRSISKREIFAYLGEVMLLLEPPGDSIPHAAERRRIIFKINLDIRDILCAYSQPRAPALSFDVVAALDRIEDHKQALLQVMTNQETGV